MKEQVLGRNNRWHKWTGWLSIGGETLRLIQLGRRIEGCREEKTIGRILGMKDFTPVDSLRVRELRAG